MTTDGKATSGVGRRPAGAMLGVAAQDRDEVVAGVLERFPEVARVGRAIYSAEGLRLFLTTPLSRFDGGTALQLIADGQVDRVVSALAADYEGLG